MTTRIKSIIPHLWFDKEAKGAADFYVSVFRDSKIVTHSRITDTPSGDVDIVTFDLTGQRFSGISAGPMFRFNNSLSFFVYCGSDAEIERLYEALSEGGSVLMPLGKYDWTTKYAWVTDKFGLSWQLDIDDINSPQKIVPALLFVNEKAERVKEAITYYSSVFPESRILMEAPHDKSANFAEGALIFAQFKLSGFIFNAMSSPHHHDYDFNESVSFMLYCEDQEEVDYYWEKLTSGGQEQQCGWVKDRFGLSWQVIPAEMDRLMSTGDKAQTERVTQAMLKMVKLDINELKKAAAE